MTIDIHLLPSWPQSQDSLKSQMDELIQVANRLGLYDAATMLSRRSAPAPPPEPPTDDELMALAVTVFENPFATDKDYARAVLEKWGNH